MIEDATPSATGGLWDSVSYLILSLISSTALPRGCDKVPNQRRRRSPRMTANYALDADGPSPHTVQLGEGPPTKEELLVYYPAKFTWKQLKTFVNSGYFCMLYVLVAIVESLSPGILGCSNVTRNFSNDMIVGLKGSRPSMEAMVIDFLSFLLRFSSSVENYLIRYRLQWGKVDTLSKLPSRLSPPVVIAEKDDVGTGKVALLASGLPPIPPDTKPYFTANIPLQLVSIIMNDWPYSGGCTCLWLLCIR
jgi:hypothetical protein